MPKKILSSGFALIGKIIRGVLHVVKSVVKPFIGLWLIVMLLVLGVMWVAMVLTYLCSMPLFQYVGPSSYIMSQIAGLSIFLSAVIPVIGLILLITKYFSEYRIPEEWRTRMRLTWVVSFLVAIFSVFNISNSYQYATEYSSIEEFNVPGSVIQLEQNKTKFQNNTVGVHMDHLIYNRQGLYCTDVHYEIHKSEDEEVRIETIIESNGESKEVSEKLINEVNATYSYDDGVFQLPSTFKIKKGTKYRGQSVLVKIMVPEDQELKMTSKIGKNLRNSPFVGKKSRPQNFMDYTWTMTENGLQSAEWDKEYKAEKIIVSDKLSNINIEGEINATVKYGSQNEIKLKGPKADLEKIESVITDDATSLLLDEWVNDDVEIIVTTSQLDILHAKRVRSLRIEGFKQDKMEIHFVDGSNLKAYIDVEDLTCTLNTYAKNTFIGSGKRFFVKTDQSPKVIAEQYKTDEVKIDGNVAHNSSFYAAEKFDCDIDRTYRYSILGNPVINGGQGTEENIEPEKAPAPTENKRILESERKILETELEEVQNDIKSNIQEVQKEKEELLKEIDNMNRR